MAKVMIKVAKGGDPKVPVSSDFDIRDSLSALIGKGNALSPDDKAGIYGNLVAKLGEGKARKVMDHAYIFNSRPETQKMPIEDRLRSFYTIGSNDADVQGLIEKSKSLGYGVLPGFRRSSNALNQELAGQVAAVSPGVVDPEVQRKILLQVRK